MTNDSSIIRLRRWGVVLAAAVSLCAPPQSSALDAGDFEYWLKANFLVGLDGQWKVNFEERLTFRDEARRLDDGQTDFCFFYSGLADWLVLGLGYKETFKKDGSDWLTEHCPLVNIIVKGNSTG